MPRNLVKTTDDSSYGARADRSIQSGRVISVDKTKGEVILDVGMVDANGTPQYMHGVPFSPQTPPQKQDVVALLRTNSSPYSLTIGSGAQVGGANSGQVVEAGGAVTSIKKTGEATGQQGAVELEATGGLTLARTLKKFSFSNTVTPSEIGGLQTTGVSAVHTGQHQIYIYDAGVGSSQAFTLPNLILASGAGQALHYTFINSSSYTLTVTANTVTYANFVGIASISAVTVLPGTAVDIVGIQGTGSDGIWRDTTVNDYIRFKTIQSGTTYTLALVDFGSLIEFTSATAVTVTIPPNSSAVFPIGSMIEVCQYGAGKVTVAAGAGVTLLSPGSVLSTASQYSTIRLRKTATDTWVCLTEPLAGLANPMTLLGDIIQGDTAGVPIRLAGNITATRKFLRQTGTGSVSAAPAWDTIGATDVAALTGITGQVEFAKGANVASANNLALGTDGNVFHITGTTQINLLSSTSWQAGSVVLLIFDGICTVKHNQGVSGANKPILLQGAVDYVTAANSMLVLTYDGTSWFDIRIGIATGSSGSPTLTANAQSGTTYTLVLTDAGKIIECTNASAFTLTIPTNASVAFPIGTTIEVWQGGAIFQVTIAAAGGVTLQSRGGLVKTNAQYSIIRLYKRATDTWCLSDDLG